MSILDIRPTNEYWNMKKRIKKEKDETQLRKQDKFENKMLAKGFLFEKGMYGMDKHITLDWLIKKVIKKDCHFTLSQNPFKIQKKGEKWVAIFKVDNVGYQAGANTPIEAVANLWLELNTPSPRG